MLYNNKKSSNIGKFFLLILLFSSFFVGLMFLIPVNFYIRPDIKDVNNLKGDNSEYITGSQFEIADDYHVFYKENITDVELLCNKTQTFDGETNTSVEIETGDWNSTTATLYFHDISEILPQNQI